ncbi:HMA2 domain-containing protein [Campylobacter sp. RM16190]|uniref:HMA2 domain-containing protein n=1 Tax=Campylobacter sp. RM16190 TaxID=1705727 RepID=UPI001473A73D|nr:hypothetical protein [Campylobacter sp. RM16190]
MSVAPNLILPDLIVKITSYFTPIHHTPGRLRVRVSAKIKDEASNLNLDKIDQIIKNIDGIKNVKFNQLIGSVTIEYDSAIFPKDIWDDLLAGRNLDKISQTINELARSAYAG